MTEPSDRAWMEMAFGLAAKAHGRTSPNPCVGAVLVRDGEAVGAGYHEAAGRPHAEAAALARAGARARGACLYVTLEPCPHWGRTPPCADAVIAAGVVRVVAAELDVNPLTRGRGAARLRRAGIKVETGLLAEKNDRLNAAYKKHITRRIPYVTLKAAASLDGKLATRTGASRWIASPAALEYTHLLRAEHDAILVGAGTVLRDNPRLTVRHKLWPNRTIVRVLLDADLRTPITANVFEEPEGGPVLIFCRAGAPASRRKALLRRGAEIVEVAARAGRLDLDEVLRVLGRRDIVSVLVEGGGRVATSFLEGRRVDRLLLVIAPRLIGGETAVGLFGGRGPDELAGALDLHSVRAFGLGGDLIVEGIF